MRNSSYDATIVYEIRKIGFEIRKKITWKDTIQPLPGIIKAKSTSASLIFDEFPMIYFHNMEGLIAIAKSNLVSTCLWVCRIFHSYTMYFTFLLQ